MPNIVTANHLRSGEVVYLGKGDAWVRELSGARVAMSKAETEALEAIAHRAAAEQIVTGQYAMDVALVDGQPIPLSVRERIRARQKLTD